MSGIGKAIGGIFGGGGGGSAKPPPPPPPLPMPDLLDPAIAAAQRRRLEASYGRSGFQSTLLADGGDYSNDKLGSR